MRTVRNLLRSKSRTALTTAGVAIGIFSLTVMGALTERLQRMVADAEEYVGSAVFLSTKTNAEGINPGITEADLAHIRALPGVRAVHPQLAIMLDGWDPSAYTFSLGTTQPIVLGEDPAVLADFHPGLTLREGRWLRPGDSFHVLVSGRIARKRGWRIGGRIPVRHRDYEVVGLFDAPDVPWIPDAVVPYDRLRDDYQQPTRERLKKVLRPLFQAVPQLEQQADALADELENSYYLYKVQPVRPQDSEEIARRIDQELPALAVMPPSKLIGQAREALGIFTWIMLAVGTVSSLVAGLLIANTMVVAVLERRREIGIKMAVGASPAQIAGEFLAEATIFALCGALGGLALGCPAVLIGDAWIAARSPTGQSIFLLTGRLLVGVVAVAGLIGAASGVYPALRSARLDPAEALRNL